MENHFESEVWQKFKMWHKVNFENSFTTQNVPLLMQNFKESINISLVWIFDEKTGALMRT